MSQVELNGLPTQAREQPHCDSPASRLEQPQCDSTRVHHDESTNSNILVSVVMPCLNEARTVAACIDQAHAGCQAALAMRNEPLIALQAESAMMTSSPLAPYAGRGVGGEGLLATSQDIALPKDYCPIFTYEIIIADNGSTDGSQAIAEAHGARIVHVSRKGYGAALLGGFAAARGKYIVMGDSDCSYDFGEIPRFLDKLEGGYDLVMGNRFTGGIMSGAMPWHHRYIGNPILSGIGRLLYRTPCRDWHCGLRAFDREKFENAELRSAGMELASEMPLRASQSGLRALEIPVKLYPDGRDRPPHLRSIRDGVRHLSVLLCMSSRRMRESLVLCFVSPVALLVSLWFFDFFSSLETEVVFPDPVALDEQSFTDGLAQFNCVINSPKRLSILGVKTSCGCIWSDDPPLVVEKGESKAIQFNVDRSKSRAKANIPLELQVTFLTNGEAESIVKEFTIVPAMDF